MSEDMKYIYMILLNKEEYKYALKEAGYTHETLVAYIQKRLNQRRRKNNVIEALHNR